MKSLTHQVGGDHYTKKAVQPWEIVDEYDLGYYEGTAVTYILRHKGDHLEDLKKAIHTLERAVESYVEKERRRTQVPAELPRPKLPPHLRKAKHTCQACNAEFTVSPYNTHCPNCNAHREYTPL